MRGQGANSSKRNSRVKSFEPSNTIELRIDYSHFVDYDDGEEAEDLDGMSPFLSYYFSFKWPYSKGGITY